MIFPITEHVAKRNDHTSFYLACGAADAPLIIFVHGWPELSISWRHQLPVFAALGFRAIAPDMRGYGRSTPAPFEAGELCASMSKSTPCRPRASARRAPTSSAAGSAGCPPLRSWSTTHICPRTGSRCMSRSGSATPYRTSRRKKAKLLRRIEINKYSGLPSLRGRHLVPERY